VMVLVAPARRLRRMLAVTVMGALVRCRGHRSHDLIYLPPRHMSATDVSSRPPPTT
jgi:hypothetical protein